MKTMNISLPEALKQWAERQAGKGQYSNTSDYVRDLIRRDQQRKEQIDRMQDLVTEALESGKGTRTMAELKALGRARTNKA
jgi:antitoxin ParD1/3/4